MWLCPPPMCFADDLQSCCLWFLGWIWKRTHRLLWTAPVSGELLKRVRPTGRAESQWPVMFLLSHCLLQAHAHTHTNSHTGPSCTLIWTDCMSTYMNYGLRRMHYLLSRIKKACSGTGCRHNITTHTHTQTRERRALEEHSLEISGNSERHPSPLQFTFSFPAERPGLYLQQLLSQTCSPHLYAGFPFHFIPSSPSCVFTVTPFLRLLPVLHLSPSFLSSPSFPFWSFHLHFPFSS